MTKNCGHNMKIKLKNDLKIIAKSTEIKNKLININRIRNNEYFRDLEYAIILFNCTNLVSSVNFPSTDMHELINCMTTHKIYHL